MTGQTHFGRSVNFSPPIIEASSTTQTPSFGERWRPGSRRTETIELLLRCSLLPNIRYPAGKDTRRP
jgi:hypothetical protein